MRRSCPNTHLILSSSMNLKTIYGMFWKFMAIVVAVMLQMIPEAAAEPLPALTCNVTPLTDGSVLYKLSRPANTSQCKDSCWQDRNNTVIALDSDFLPEKAVNVTNQSIQLKDCQDYMRYTVSCNRAWKEVICTFNCSLLLDPPVNTVNGSLLLDPTVNTVNSTQICITETWCPTPLVFGLGIFGILLLLVGVCGGPYLWSVCKRRRRSAAITTSYTPANEQEQEIKLEIII